MPQNDPRRSGQNYSLTLRPFTGRNSDLDQASIEANQASGGTNWTVRKGSLFRRPSISRIGQLATLPCGTANDIHQIFSVATPNLTASNKGSVDVTVLRIVGRAGIFQVNSPTTRGSLVGNSYNRGTVSLSTGSRTMAGTGTAWLARGIHPGASLTVGAQSLAIRSVTSNTSIELVSLPSAGGTGLSYSTTRYGTSQGVRSLQDGSIQPAVYSALSRTTSSVSVSGGTNVRDIGGSVTSGNLAVTPGSRTVTATGVRVGSWLRLKNDVGAEIDGLDRHSDLRSYCLVGATLLNERFRGTAGAGSAGAWNNIAIRGQFGSQLNTGYVQAWDINPSGTVTISQGSATVNGTGANFSTTLLLRAGDEIGLEAGGTGIRWYRIASVQSNAQLTLAHPFDFPSVSGVGFYTNWYRSVTGPVYESNTIQASSGTVIANSLPNGTGAYDRFAIRPTFWKWDSEPDRRFQVATAILSDPSRTAGDNYEQSFVSTAQMTSVHHNIYWGYENDTVWTNVAMTGSARTFSITSNTAPLARLIEAWNGRLFAGDVGVFDVALSVVRTLYPFRIMWTRVNEPYSWWNQYPTDGAGAANINNGTGDLITMKKLGIQNALVIYRGYGITLLRPTGDSINPFTQDYLNVGPAPIGPDALISWENGHLYLCRDGRILNFNGSRIDAFPCPLTRFIEDNINWNYAHWTQAVRNEADGEFMWFIPTTASRNLTYAIVYNYREGSWYIQDFTAHPLQAVAYVDKLDYTLERRLFAVDSNRNLVAFRSDGPGIDFTASIGGGTLFSSQWVSKEMVLPIPDLTSEDREKEVNAIEVAYDPTYSGRLQMEVSGDGGINWANFGTNTLTYGSTAGTSLSRGNGMVVGRTHMVRLTQTPANTTTDTSMSLRWLRIHYADYGAVPA
ncbi:MAG: hypothetical protein QME66_08255 [Candidatus Eisenbacteria bacterium]|nr:hypothetical protein [Candidatus Eisenbacteria bacterium]